MNLKRLVFLFSFLLAVNVNGQTLSTEKLKEDYDTLLHALEEAHGGLYRFNSKSETDRLFQKFRKSLKGPMSQWQFYGLLSNMLASLGDGHMKIEYAGAPAKPLFFPFRILTENQRAIILSNDTRNDSIIKPGMVLVSINGHSFKAIKKSILPRIAGDGHIQTGKIASLSRNFSQYYRAFVDSSSIFITKVKDTSGKIFTVTVNGLSNSEREANRNINLVNAEVNRLTAPLEGSKENVSLRFPTDSIAYLRIRYFIGDSFDKEIDSVLAIILKRKAKSLVLDIRGNGGGTDEWSAFVISRLAAKPFRYLDRIHARVLVPSFADWKNKPPVDLVKGAEPDLKGGGYLIKPLLNRTLLEQHPAEHRFTGKLIVLIDGKTFSAASDFSAVLSNVTDAVFVGVETGGAYEGNTSALNAILKLPNSKFKVNIHLWELWSAIEPPKVRGEGVKPDYHVERNVNDWLNGIDTQLQFALKIAQEKID